MAEILEGYAGRGVFRGFSRVGPDRYRMLWHRGRLFELILDSGRNTLQFPAVLPDIEKNSPMTADFRAFLKSRFAAERPEHRRLDRKKIRLRGAPAGGHLSLTMTVLDGDYQYATRKLIHLVHEIYLDFLSDGRYYEYMIETFDLDPDKF